jgi:hypothetical protein
MALLCCEAGGAAAEKAVGGSDRAAADGAEGLAVGAHKGCNAEADVGGSRCRGYCRLRQPPRPLSRVVPQHWPQQLAGC